MTKKSSGRNSKTVKKRFASSKGEALSASDNRPSKSIYLLEERRKNRDLCSRRRKGRKKVEREKKKGGV